MEVTLNHNIRQFFLLAPDILRKRLFEKLFGRPFCGAFVMHGPGLDTEFALGNCMQPDFLFTSEAEVVSLEMKVKAKCSVDQKVSAHQVLRTPFARSLPVRHSDLLGLPSARFRQEQ